MSFLQLPAAATLALLALFGSDQVMARQGVTAPALKAAFLLNFARFTTWPADALPPGGKLAICVSGDNRLADAVEDLARRQRIEDREILVQRVTSTTAGSCHMLYWSASDVGRDPNVLRAVAGKPVLTVSDSSEFPGIGGLMYFFVDGGKMRFAVNPTAAERANLKISSKLLNFAKIIKDR